MPLSIIFQLYHGRKKKEKDINVDSTTACLMVTQQMFSFVKLIFNVLFLGWVFQGNLVWEDRRHLFFWF